MLEVNHNVDCKYPDTKMSIQIWRESEGENLTVEEVTYCVFEIFWANRWSTFSCISYFVLESR